MKSGFGPFLRNINLSAVVAAGPATYDEIIKGRHLTVRMDIQSLKSTATGLSLLPPGLEPEVAEYDRRGIACLTSAPVGEGHLIGLELKLHFNDLSFACPAMAVVTACTPVADGVHRVRLRLRQIDNELWIRFLDHANERQSRLDRIFAAMKGDV